MITHDEYFEWLMQIIEGPREYSYVLERLYNTEFYSPVPRDDNRAVDGVELRYMYQDETDDICEKDGCCSVLEMMIGLAMRIDNDYLYEYIYGDRTAEWFWEMMHNLRLDYYDDYNYDPDEVRYILEKFLDRKYGKHGQNSLFPCQFAGQKWKDLEIWYQLNRYILEKYDS